MHDFVNQSIILRHSIFGLAFILLLPKKLMDHSSIRQTFELGKFIITAVKSILNLVKSEVWLQNIVKRGKYSHVKFANFV